MAETLLATGDTSKALQNIQQAVAVSEQMQRLHPKDLKVLQELTENYETEADIFGGTFNVSNLGNTSAALAYRQKELSLREELARLRPNDPSVQRTMGVTITKMGDQLMLNGQWREALDYYRRAQQSFEALAAAPSPNSRVLDNLHGLYTRLQQVEMWSGNPQQAVVTNRKALALSREISRTDASNNYGVLVVASDYGNLADSLSRAGVKREAISTIGQALEMMSELVARNPRNTEYSGLQAAEYVTAGDVSRRFGDYRGALDYYREGIRISSQIQSADPSNVDVRLRLAEIETELGRTLVQLRDLSSAAEAYQKALALAQPNTSNALGEEEPYARANAYAGIGEVEQALATASAHARQEHWPKACSHAHSRHVWKQVYEPVSVRPRRYRRRSKGDDRNPSTLAI